MIIKNIHYIEVRSNMKSDRNNCATFAQFKTTVVGVMTKNTPANMTVEQC